MDKNKIGLACGLFLAIVHVIWSTAVAIIPNQLQTFVNWIFTLHALTPMWQITAFNFINAILLIIVTFVIGYIFGWILALCHSLIHEN